MEPDLFLSTQEEENLFENCSAYIDKNLEEFKEETGFLQSQINISRLVANHIKKKVRVGVVQKNTKLVAFPERRENFLLSIVYSFNATFLKKVKPLTLARLKENFRETYGKDISVPPKEGYSLSLLPLIAYMYGFPLVVFRSDDNYLLRGPSL